MMFRKILLSTIRVVLIITLTIPLRSGLAEVRPLSEPPEGDNRTGGGPSDPDCLDHRQPRLCTRVVEELAEELGFFNEVFAAPDADELAAFYHEDAILFVGSTGRFFRGRDEIRNDFFVPLLADINNATVDISAFHFQVISLNLVILYGSPTAVVTSKDGSVVTLPPLPQTLTWVREGRDHARSFLVLTDHE